MIQKRAARSSSNGADCYVIVAGQAGRTSYQRPERLRAHRQGVDRDSGPRPKSGRSGLPLPTHDKRRCALHLCDRLRFHRNTQGVATAADGAKRHALPSGVRCRSRSACRISNGRLWQYGRSLCVRLMSHLDENQLRG